MSQADRAAVEKRFSPQPTSNDKREKLVRLQEAAMEYTTILQQCCPPSRERALAETHAETAAMFATKAVTHND